MDIFFRDPSEIPLPARDVRVRQLQAKPWPDGRRVRIYLELTPFQQRPSGEIAILNASGEEVSSASIIETIDPRMELTLHLKGEPHKGDFTVIVTIFYLDEGDENLDKTPPEQGKKLVVAQAQTNFSIEG